MSRRKHRDLAEQYPRRRVIHEESSVDWGAVAVGGAAVAALAGLFFTDTGTEILEDHGRACAREAERKAKLHTLEAKTEIQRRILDIELEIARKEGTWDGRLDCYALRRELEILRETLKRYS